MDRIDDTTIEYVAILAKLELSDEEKEQAKKELSRMLEHIDKMKELDTAGIESAAYIFPIQNVFREDVITNCEESEKILSNAPKQQYHMFVVPRTFEV